MITPIDKEYMEIALKEAREGYERGDFPVGAVITLDNKMQGKGNNATRTNGEWSSHAESSLIRAHAPSIQKAVKEGKLVTLYTTLEPCLMCLGTSRLNRVGRMVYACPDPYGGATGLDIKSIAKWYSKAWPSIDSGIFREESYSLLVNYMEQNETWKSTLECFKEMYKAW